MCWNAGRSKLEIKRLLPPRKLLVAPGREIRMQRRGREERRGEREGWRAIPGRPRGREPPIHRCRRGDRKSTRLNSSHLGISYAVFCLKKKKTHESDKSTGGHHDSVHFRLYTIVVID